jgi:hypothetical protein
LAAFNRNFQRLKLKYDEPLSNFAFKFNLRRHTKGSRNVGWPVCPNGVCTEMGALGCVGEDAASKKAGGGYVLLSLCTKRVRSRLERQLLV